MFDIIKEKIFKTISSRLFILFLFIVIIFAVCVVKLFNLQIINGAEYLENFTLSIEKEITTDGTRGNIYDRNGVLLAHNELSYNITITDSGSYDTTSEKNSELNAEISTLIDMIEENGDTIDNDLYLTMDTDGTLSFTADGTTLLRFKADIYGRSSVDELVVNEELGYNEANATPEQVYEYLISEYSIDTEVYSEYRAFQIAIVRYGLAQNAYQKYVATDVATDVSDETVAMISEHASELIGVEVEETTKRVYDYAEYFSHIIGYTGKIDSDEYEELSAQDDSYTLNDIVGKAGIEEEMELYLQGTKGSETVYVNSVGKVLEVKESTDSEAGNDVYLSLDADLQIAVYDMIEQELAGILYSKIINSKTYSGDDLYIPIYDVYVALIENSVIDIEAFEDAEEDSVSAAVYETFVTSKADVIEDLKSALKSDTAYEDLSEEMQEYVIYTVSMLQDDGIFDADAIDTSDSVYTTWKSGDISVKEYLEYAIDSSWIDITYLQIDDQYADTSEIYTVLISYIESLLESEEGFDQIVYKYLIMNDDVSGRQLCIILFEQDVLEEDEEALSDLKDGTISAYTFLKEKIENIEITPAQLALDPCTGSCVIMDPDTGDLLACVTYPGYDTNKLANNMDSDYYNSLLEDGSLPLYNNATQQATAPGSTFKMVIAAAGLTENVITTTTEITDEGSFTKLNLDQHCWVYPSNHGSINVSEALRDSCNYFFSEVGYRLSLKSGSYSEEKGISTIQTYADLFGLGDTTGVEIAEGTSQVADELPIAASIGQSNNNFTTIQLARYVAAIANEGTVYNLTVLDKVTDSDGNVIEEYSAEVRNEITEISDSTWDAIQEGMRMVVLDHSQFDDLEVELAGKTGTAQESDSRPNHALFVGYAPYDDPEIAIAVRIAYGYASANACYLVDDIMKYYFEEESADSLITGTASDNGDSSNSFTD